MVSISHIATLNLMISVSNLLTTNFAVVGLVVGDNEVIILSRGLICRMPATGTQLSLIINFLAIHPSIVTMVILINYRLLLIGIIRLSRWLTYSRRLLIRDFRYRSCICLSPIGHHNHPSN